MVGHETDDGQVEDVGHPLGGQARGFPGAFAVKTGRALEGFDEGARGFTSLVEAPERVRKLGRFLEQFGGRIARLEPRLPGVHFPDESRGSAGICGFFPGFEDRHAGVEEARELAAKRSGESADPARLQSRLDAIDREQLLRTAELRQKSQLRITMRLIAALTIRQPKLLVTATLESKRPPPAPVRIVWDPLTEAAEAMACPQCGQGSFDLWPTRDGRAVCEACAAAAARSRR